MNAAFERFEQLDEEDFFLSFVQEYFEGGWQRVAQASHSHLIADPAVIKLAHQQYHLSVERYALALPSQNPDHYKRAGSLLHALYQNPIAEVRWADEVARLKDQDAVGVSHADAEYWNNFTAYYEGNCNRIMAFDLSFRCCDRYEESKKNYNKDFLDNMCYYMATNTDINVGSFVMIFKSFWS